MNISGLHAVKAHLKRQPDSFLRLNVQKNRMDKSIQQLIQLARENHIKVTQVDRTLLDNLSDGAAHQGVVAQCQEYEPYSEAEFEIHFETLTQPLLLAIEDVQDPRNLGACLRSAAGAGVDGVLLPKSRSAPIRETTFKAASGALSDLYVAQVANLSRTIRWLKQKGVWVVGTDDSAPESFLEPDYSISTMLVVGNENKGLRELTKKHCDSLVSIPMATESVSSLNVAVATGIVLYECNRQRIKAT